MLKKEELWDYFIKFLPGDSHFFNELNIPDDLLKKMFDQTLDVKIIMGILNYCDSIEKILIVINSQIKIIADCLTKNNETISMSSLPVKAKKTDDIENIIKEIENINISRIIKNILIIFLTKEKNENKTPDLDLCQSLAIKLENEKVKNWLNINSVLYNIIINNSQTEIYFISMFYKKLSGNSIIEKIDKEIIEDEKYYFIQIILSLTSLEEYFTKKLYKAINDKNENIILRILITRRDIDLETIKQCYFQLYNETLINDIKNFFSGDSYKLISNIIGM
jgi:hypothetical protein